MLHRGLEKLAQIAGETHPVEALLGLAKLEQGVTVDLQ